jgi:hypothetical protein
MFKIYVWSPFTTIFPCSIIILRVECVHFICFLLGFVVYTIKHVVSRNDSSSYPSQSFLSHRCNIYSFTRRIMLYFISSSVSNSWKTEFSKGYLFCIMLTHWKAATSVELAPIFWHWLLLYVLKLLEELNYLLNNRLFRLQNQTKCKYTSHKSAVLCYSYKFRHTCAIFGEFTHQI